MGDPAVRFGILGPLSVHHRGQPVPLPRSTVVRGLLGVLLAAEGVPLSADRLARLVWASRVEDVRPASVHVGVFRLRRWLADLAAGPGDAGASVEHDAHGYRLTVDPRALDLSCLRELVARAARKDDPAQRQTLLGAAIALCRGRLLADLDVVDRNEPLMRALGETVRSAILAYADAALRSGKPEPALRALADHVGREPLDEPAQARLIALLAACGRPAEALARYEEVRIRLADDLGVHPSDEVQQAYLAVLARDRAVPAASATAPGGQIRPEVLPPDIVGVTGREDELRLLQELLTVGGRPAIVALTGRAGVGKTTLAVHAAHLLRDQYPDGQLYVDLHGAESCPADPARVLARFLRLLGVDGRQLPDGLDERSELYRHLLAGRRALILLDGAADERQIHPLLPGCSGSAVLVTSRRQITGLATRSLRLDVLEPAAATRLLGRIIGDNRVAAQPAESAEVARLCGNLPLALTIAGSRLARLPHRSPGWLAARLADDRRRLDELALDDLEVRASLALSYRGLPPAAGRLFRRLGLLRVPAVPGWVAAELLGDEPGEAADALDHLVEAHLLDPGGAGPDGEVRYRQHDLVRIYARECVEAEEPAAERSAAVRRALAGWSARAQEADRRLPRSLPRFASAERDGRAAVPGPARPAVAPADPLRWFEAERSALVAAVAQAYQCGADDVCWSLASCLDGFFEAGGYYDSWARTHATALLAAERAGHRGGAARILYSLGELHADRDRYETALDCFQRARQMLNGLDDPVALAHVRRGTGVGARVLGQLDVARTELEAALAVFVGHADRNGIADAAHGLGAIHREQGRLDEAAECYQTALTLYEEIGEEFTQAIVLCSLGVVHRLAGRSAAAEACLRRSLELNRRLGHRAGEAYALCYLGELYTELEQVEPARTVLEAARTICDEVGERFGLGLTLRAIGELQYAAGDIADAHRTLRQALDIWRELDAPIWQARVLETLGRVYYEQGSEGEARTAWSTALQHFRALGAPETERVAAHLNGLRASR
jgi:DNA-binding SARP family transcriptional activator/predicted negative regulator of RcsB-dependent stress response